MKVKLTPAEAQLVAGHMAEIVETMQDDYGPDEQRAVALASSVLDKLRG
jgi:siderophore synthetase component